ncbi:MAG: excalibur calcium-binding domain-containing protein [Novosphingobium sp.]
MARHHHRQEQGSAWGPLLGATAMFGYGCYLYASPPAAISPRERARIAKVERSVTYSGCREARRAGATPLYAGQPGYRVTMDGDGDGIACEDY